MTSAHARPFSRALRITALAGTMTAASLAGACNNAGEGLLSGAALGSLAGMGIGSLSGNMGKGAAAGAIIGGLTGLFIGDQNARRSGW